MAPLLLYSPFKTIKQDTVALVLVPEQLLPPKPILLVTILNLKA